MRPKVPNGASDLFLFNHQNIMEALVKPTVISVAFAKGGSAKTTSAWSLGSCLEWSHRVLFWDVDPQRSLSSALVDFSEVTATGYDVLVNKMNPADAIIPALPTYGEKAKLIPASNLLTGLEAATATNIDRQHIFADAIAGITVHPPMR